MYVQSQRLLMIEYHFHEVKNQKIRKIIADRLLRSFLEQNPQRNVIKRQDIISPLFDPHKIEMKKVVQIAQVFGLCYNNNRKFEKMSYLNLQRINQLVNSVLVQKQLMQEYKNIAIKYKLDIIQSPQQINRLANTINSRMTKSTNQTAKQGIKQSDSVSHWVLGEYKLFKIVLALYSIYNSITIPSLTNKNIKELQQIFHQKPPIIIDYQIVAMTRKPRAWSEHQNSLLVNIIGERTEPHWKDVVLQLFRLSNNRYFRQFSECREHWNTRLCPNIKKSKWTPQQDIKLLQMIEADGFKWSSISKKMNGERSQHTVKNRYNCLMKKFISSNKNCEGTLAEQLLAKLQKKRAELSFTLPCEKFINEKQEQSITQIPSQRKTIEMLNEPINAQFPIEMYLNFEFNSPL